MPRSTGRLCRSSSTSCPAGGFVHSLTPLTRSRGSPLSALRRLAVSAGFLVSLVPEAVAQTGVPLEPQAWYAVLSDEFGNPAVQRQVGKAAEGAAIKAVFDDSAKAGLPAEEQLAAARKIAQFIWPTRRRIRHSRSSSWAGGFPTKECPMCRASVFP